MKSILRLALIPLLVAAGCLDQPFATNVDLPLQVLAVVPSDGATGVARDAPIKVFFNLPVVDQSVTQADAIVVEDVTNPDAPVAIEGERAYAQPSDDTPATATFTPSALLPYSSKIRVRVTTAVQRAPGQGIPEGTLLKEVVAIFETAHPPPLEVVSVAPAAGATGVARDAAIAITFSEPVRCATLEAGLSITQAFDAHPRIASAGQTVPVAGALACTDPPSIEDTGCADGACTVVFTPAEPFEYSSTIAVSLTGGARADGAVESFRATDSGGQLPADASWTFTTLHPAPLSLTGSQPSASAEQVALDTPITLVFSEPVSCSSLQTHLLVQETLDATRGGATNAVAGTLSCTSPASIDALACDGGACTATFTPDAAFTLSSLVTVTLSGGAHPDAVESNRATTQGGQLPADVQFAFYVLDPAPLALTASSPATGAEEVPATTDLVLTFSEDVDCTSITDAITAGTLTVAETLDDGAAGPARTPTLASCAANVATLSFDPDFSLSSLVTVALPDTIDSARATTRAGNLVGGAGITFRIEDPPTLLLLSSNPGNGARDVPVETDLALVFSEDVDCATIQSAVDGGTLFAIQTNDDGSTGAAIATTLASCVGANATLAFDPDFSLSADVDVTLPDTILSARATSRGGNLVGGAAIGFRVEDPPTLRVLSTFPGNGATSIALDANVVVNFSEAVDCATVQAAIADATLFVRETFDDEVALDRGAGSVDHGVVVASCDAARLELDLTGDLELSSSVEVRLPGTVASVRATLSGGFLEDGAGYGWFFDTSDPPDLLVVQTTPGNGNTLVPNDDPIVVAFSEPVDLTTVGETSFVVEELDASGNVVATLSTSCGTAADGAAAGSPCSYVPSADGTQVAFAPPAELKFDTRYRFTLTTDIRSDRATGEGGNLGATLVYEFKTIVSPPIEVVDLRPTTDIVGVQPTFTVTFNQEIFPPTFLPTEPDADLDVFLSPVANAGDEPDPANRVALTCASCNDQSDTYAFTPQAPLPEGALFVFVVRGDLDGVRGTRGGSIMLADFKKTYLTTTNTLLAFTTPADGDTDVNPAAPVCATFVEDIDAATIDSSTFVVEALNELGTLTTLTGTYVLDGVDLSTGDPTGGTNRVCFFPDPAQLPCRELDELLPASAAITVTLDETIASVGGTALGADVAYAFTTGELPNATGFGHDRVAAVGGGGALAGEDDVPVNASFTVSFDAAVDAAALPAGIELVDLRDGSAVAFTASAEAAGMTVRVQPSANLAFVDDNAQGYALRVVAGANGFRFADGRYLGEDAMAAFTTSPKTRVEISPPQGENATAASTTPVAFSRPMHAPSLTTDNIFAFDNTDAFVLTSIVAVNAADDDAAILIPVPTYVVGHNVTIHVTTGVMDFLGNPLPQETTVNYASIQNAPALNARTPAALATTNLVPNTGTVKGDQVFVLTLPPPGAQLQNRMLPPSFNDATLRIKDLDGCHGPAGDFLSQTNDYDIGAATLADVVRFQADVALRAGCDYEVRVVQSELSNIYTAANTQADVVVTVTGEAVAPTLSSTSPANGATGVVADTVVTATFSENMDSATFDATTFRLSDGTADVTGAVEVSGATATFVPDAPLRGGTTYSLVIGGVRDAAGNAFAGTTRTFTVENVAPTVASVAFDAATGNLVATFSERMADTSVSPDTTTTVGTLQVRLGGVTVLGCVHLDETGTVATFAPLEPLGAGSYDVTVTTDATDLGGTALAAPSTTAVTVP